MVIDFTLHKQLGSGGAYADIFSVDGKAYKLFKSGPEFPPRQTREGRRRVYASQVEAYSRAGCDPELSRHTARFYGPCVIEDVIGLDGNSIRDTYLLDACYAVEILIGDELKVTATEAVEKYPHITKARIAFERLGIQTSDASVFNYNDAEKFKFIDIETQLS